MTDTPPQPLPSPSPLPPANAPLNDERQMAFIVYLAYLASIVFQPLSLVGVVLAYVSRDTAPDWLQSHYSYQIRTFWIGLLYLAVSVLLCFVLIGFVLLLACLAWFIIRCALGIDRIFKREPPANPLSWLI
jgi:uncharacterized membrane protein